MIMQSAIYGLSLFFITISLNAQQKWGYALASVKYDGHEVLYISEVVKLSSLNCNIEKSVDSVSSDEDLTQSYKKCIRLWFYDKIKTLGPKATSYIELQDIVGEVERHTDYTKLFKNPPENLHFNKPAYNYLSNKGAKQKRKRAMQFCEPDKCEIVILR